MIKLTHFDNYEPSGISYGGHGGSKRGIIIDGEKWFLKYPKSTRSMQVAGLSYTTTPLSEYIGSHIYNSIGIETHETKLGISNGKIVVACKDFLNESETIFDYNMVKNEYDEKVENAIDSLSSSGALNSNENIEEVFVIMENNSYFKKFPELKKRFWDMFVIDAFISNNDRNEENWGLVLDKRTGKVRIAPIFDNGAAFYNKSDDEKLNNLYLDKNKFMQVAYDSSISIYRENGKNINPLKYIESIKSKECNDAILRIVPTIDMTKIKNIFNEIPEKYNEIQVLSEAQKSFYFKILEYRYENILLPTYNKILNIDSNNHNK